MARWTRAAWLAVAMAVGVELSGEEIFRRMSPTVRVVSYKRTYTDEIVPVSSGSGTVITADGLVLTNHHVIYDAVEQRPFDTFETAITFDLRKKPVRKYTARLVALDKGLDLALLDINPSDVWGRELPRLKYLDWDSRVSPREGQSVQVLGYPASGGETLTVTRGQISGFERLNEYTCFKTDTDIDHGSSGGTVLGRRKRLIGVPVFLRSYAENVGYILDIREARPWISAHLTDPSQVDQVAEERLIKELARYVRANETHTLQLETYPRLSMEVPEDWQFENISSDVVVIGQEGVAEPVGVMFFIERRAFPLDEGFVAEVKESMRRNQEWVTDGEESDTTFAGAPAWRISSTIEGTRRVLIHVFLGNALLRVYYEIDEHAADRQREAVEAALAGVTLIDGVDMPPPPPQRQFTFADPGVELELPEGWGGRPNMGSDAPNVLLRAWQRDNHDGVVKVTYNRLSKEVRELSLEERLKQILDQPLLSDVIHKEVGIRVDGLPGYLFISELEGNAPDEMIRTLLVFIDRGKHSLLVEYNDKAEAFDNNADAVMAMLESIRVTRPGSKGDRVTRIGPFGTRFSDVQYHRFAAEIRFLASRDLLKGYDSDRFGPEQPVTRAQALRLVIDSWNRLQEEQGGGRGIPVVEAEATAASTSGDAVPAWCGPYVAAAREHGVQWVGTDAFDGGAPVTLLEALQLLFETYAVPVWKGPGAPSWKPVMDKGYELYIIPLGLTDRNRHLTNAEMVALVRTLYGNMVIH